MKLIKTIRPEPPEPSYQIELTETERLRILAALWRLDSSLNFADSTWVNRDLWHAFNELEGARWLH